MMVAHPELLPASWGGKFAVIAQQRSVRKMKSKSKEGKGGSKEKNKERSVFARGVPEDSVGLFFF